MKSPIVWSKNKDGTYHPWNWKTIGWYITAGYWSYFITVHRYRAADLNHCLRFGKWQLE